MKKRILTALFALIWLFSLTAFASDEDNRLGMLSNLNIMVGYGDGDFGLDRAVTRAEFTKMAVAASKYRNSVATRLSVSPFSDVMYDSWYAPYVYIGAVNGVLKGYKDGSFKPDGLITYEEALTVALRLLGYEDSEFEYAWPYGQVGTAEKIGLCDNMNSGVGEIQTRNQVSHLFYNLLKTTPKNGSGDYVKAIGYEILDDIILVSSNNETQTVDKGYVYTSEGLYKTADGFDYTLVGLRGDAVLKDGKITAFLPDVQSEKTYSVFSSAGGNYILLENGEVSNYKLDKDGVLYYGMQKTTVGAFQNQFEPGDILRVYFDKDMKDDYVIYDSGELDGPFTVKGSGWMNDNGIPKDAAVIRGGNKVAASAVKKNDIIYYSPTINVVWSYCDSVIGVYESAFPNQNMPESITVSGKTYSIEGSSAYNALSSNGTLSYGDTVTLLLGKNGGVADAVSVYGEDEETVGFMVEAGVKTFTNASGREYSSNYISVVGTDGVLREYETEKDYSKDRFENSVLKLSFSGGKAAASVLKSSDSVSGTYSYSSQKLGKYILNSDSEIIDVAGKTDKDGVLWKKVFPQRLDGISFSERDIFYAEASEDNVIKKLILNNVTGDVYGYGLVTKASANNFITSGDYTYFEGASKYETTTMGITFSVHAGQPVQIRQSVQGGMQSVSMLKQLNEYEGLTAVSETYAVTGNEKYKLSDNVHVYLNSESYEYQSITLSQLLANANDYIITAFYDKTEKSGGRIRVLLAKPKTK
ncbi:MAG: S-layer homology domain-containing protein [Clostridia bacterium]|nr:S-layer homology domain-containing protein [Clostridia bacterium]